MSVLLIKYGGNGQIREELLFSLAHGDHLSKDWTRLEPKISLLLCRKRCLKNAGQPCCLHKPLCCSPMWWSSKGGCEGLLVEPGVFPEHPVGAVTEWQKILFFLYPWLCCLLPSTQLLAPARPDLYPAMQEWTPRGARLIGQKLAPWPLDGLYPASCRWQCILKLAVFHLFVVCALFCT